MSDADLTDEGLDRIRAAIRDYSPEALAADRAVCDAATEGPWMIDEAPRLAGAVSARLSGVGRQVAEATGEAAQFDYRAEPHVVQKANARFIAAARTRWPIALDVIESLTAERDELAARVKALAERRFPIMGGPSVPWRMVAPYDEQARVNHDQTLERLAERGGLAPDELWCVVHGKRWRERPMSLDALAARKWLDAWLAADVESATVERIAAWLEKRLGYAPGGSPSIEEIRAGAWKEKP